MQTVSISQFKATCLALLERVRSTGQPVLVTKRGKPVAQVVPPPLPEKSGSWLGCMAGTIQIKGDIVNPDPADEKPWTGDWKNLRRTLNQ